MPNVRIGIIAIILSCGGGKPKGPEPLARADELKRDTVVEEGADAGLGAPIVEPPVAPPSEPPPTAAAVTFELANAGDSDLVFTTTKGWQAVLFAYTGKPPKAATVFLFEQHCTASCEAGDNVCPSCPAPQNKKEELAMAKKETAAPGGAVKVPWDGKIYAYEKAPGKKCKCWKKIDPPAGGYTVKACGLRASKVKGKPSKAVCAEATLALPVSGGPQVVTLSFP